MIPIPLNWEILKGLMHAIGEITRVLCEEGILKRPKCKYCGSYHVVNYGHSKDTGVQRLRSKDCNKTFMDTT